MPKAGGTGTRKSVRVEEKAALEAAALVGVYPLFCSRTRQPRRDRG